MVKVYSTRTDLVITSFKILAIFITNPVISQVSLVLFKKIEDSLKFFLNPIRFSKS